jgi:prepilin-type N-terminal cleavage/methylation domain-containing protein
MLIKSKSTNDKLSAFTLVEVMVAVVVVAILFVSLFTGLSQGFAISAASRERLRANQVALERIEGIRLVKWSDLTNTALVPLTFTASYQPINQSGGVGITYHGKVAIVNAPLSGTPIPTYNSDVKKITVQLSWTNGTLVRTHTLATLVSRHGLQNYIYNN